MIRTLWSKAGKSSATVIARCGRNKNKTKIARIEQGSPVDLVGPSASAKIDFGVSFDGMSLKKQSEIRYE